MWGRTGAWRCIRLRGPGFDSSGMRISPRRLAPASGGRLAAMLADRHIIRSCRWRVSSAHGLAVFQAAMEHDTWQNLGGSVEMKEGERCRRHATATGNGAGWADPARLRARQRRGPATHRQRVPRRPPPGLDGCHAAATEPAHPVQILAVSLLCFLPARSARPTRDPVLRSSTQSM